MPQILLTDPLHGRHAAYAVNRSIGLSARRKAVIEMNRKAAKPQGRKTVKPIRRNCDRPQSRYHVSLRQ